MGKFITGVESMVDGSTWAFSLHLLPCLMTELRFGASTRVGFSGPASVHGDDELEAT